MNIAYASDHADQLLIIQFYCNRAVPSDCFLATLVMLVGDENVFRNSTPFLSVQCKASTVPCTISDLLVEVSGLLVSLGSDVYLNVLLQYNKFSY